MNDFSSDRSIVAHYCTTEFIRKNLESNLRCKHSNCPKLINIGERLDYYNEFKEFLQEHSL